MGCLMHTGNIEFDVPYMYQGIECIRKQAGQRFPLIQTTAQNYSFFSIFERGGYYINILLMIMSVWWRVFS